jgi:Zn-dependent peptidase ImmA (M78 family)
MAAGVPFGYLLLSAPPEWALPVPDFREGFDGAPTPSAHLIAVIGQSQRRQEWYRDYAIGIGAEPLAFVGSAANTDAIDAAARIRSALNFEVADRRGAWADTRKALLRAFESLGGLTVATSMVDDNTRRPLDENEFRGFTLVDDIAPLVFVNTRQTLNGQIFTLAHEFAHVWRGASGLGNESPRGDARSEVERWCNTVAAEVLVSRGDLAPRHARVADAPLTAALDALAHDFRCGTSSYFRRSTAPVSGASTTSPRRTTQRFSGSAQSGKAERAAAAITTTISRSGSASGCPVP